MTAWQTVEAKQKFSELVEAATHDGPQMVMRHAEPVAVVMSVQDYRALKTQANDAFASFLLSSPIGDGDVDRDVGMSLSGEA